MPWFKFQDVVERWLPAILIVGGLALMADVLWNLRPADASGFSTRADAILKIMAVIVIGALLPRIVTLKFGGAEVTLKDDTKKLSESFNSMHERVARLEATLESQPLSPASAEAARTKSHPPPDLPEPKVAGDQQKGRFGGSSRSDGYTMSASFPGNPSGDMVQVVIEVRKDDGPLSAPVRLYLHETFAEDEVDVMPKDGVARLELFTWGGFTAGAWPMETRHTLLELDLAKLPKAPRVIREH